MLGHRPLNADDYLAILKHRWWLFALPAILLSAAGIAATLYISPQYVSRTSVLIDQQKVPDELVKPVVSEDINSRLASMNEQILSRSSIQPMVEKYGLYATQHLSMDDRVDLARKNIDIKALPTGFARANGAPGFEISFTANDAHIAQMVCAEITSLFTAANLRSREAAAEGTTDFLKEQLNNAKAVLDDQDAKLAAFQQHNFGTLPEDQANNVNILTTLNTQLEAATQALSRMEQDKSYMEAMLAQQQQAAPVVGSTAAVQSAQERQLQELLAQQTDLSMHYTADYPDVVAINRKIADLRKKIAAQPAPAPGATSIAPSKNDSPSVQDLRARIHSADLGIQAKRVEQAQLSQQVRQYQGRIQSSPQIEEQFKELTRDAQTSQAQYDSLLSKLNQSQMATDLEHRQEGETFRVLDEANLPDGPTYPKRSVFAMGGFGAGLGFGLLIVALLEYMDTALRTERDIWAFTKLPTLAVIAWSGDVASLERNNRSRLKRFFSRKPPTAATPTQNPISDAPR